MKSRLGVGVDAKKLKRLSDLDAKADIIVIDEVHMFEHESDYEVIKTWVQDNKTVYASGLDTDYRAQLMPVVKRLLELQPETIVRKEAVCDICGKFRARFTCIREKSGKQVLDGLPPVVPDDGTYEYQANCRDCYFRAE